MEENPLVSVIIPTRGRPDFLERAIHSAFTQRYTPIEVVVVDENEEGSEERNTTAAAIEQFHGYGRLHYLNNRSPGGVARARNEGVAASEGELISFLDDDDYWKPEKIEAQVAALTSSGQETALVYTGREIVDQNENTLKLWLPSLRGNILNKLLVENVINTTSSVLMRRSVFEEIGGFDENAPAREDLDLFIRVARKYRIEVVPEPQTGYTHMVGHPALSKNYTKKLRGRAYIFDKYADLYAGRPDLAARYHYGTAKLSLKHRDYPAALGLLRRSLKTNFRLKTLARFLLLIIRHPGAMRRQPEDTHTTVRPRGAHSWPTRLDDS